MCCVRAPPLKPNQIIPNQTKQLQSAANAAAAALHTLQQNALTAQKTKEESEALAQQKLKMEAEAIQQNQQKKQKVLEAKANAGQALEKLKEQKREVVLEEKREKVERAKAVAAEKEKELQARKELIQKIQVWVVVVWCGLLMSGCEREWCVFVCERKS